MRTFIVLCLVAVACSDKLGYNYKPVDHSDSGLSFSPVVSSLRRVSSLGNSQYGGDYSSSPSSSSSGYDRSQVSGVGADYVPQGELEKEFYSFTANEEDFAEPEISNQIANSAKQNLRVIFIKGPENNGLENAALALAKQSSEQKTDIYVLNKQADLGNLANKLNTAYNNFNNKPEVHFVKYRTPEDAANAQRAIQNQYDSLGGSSENYNGGVAPVLNFASSAPAASRGSPDSQSSLVPQGSFNSQGSLGSLASQGSFGSIGSHGSQGAYAPLSSFGSLGSQGSFGSIGSLGSQGSPSSSYIAPSGGIGSSSPSSSYLPSYIVRRYRV